MWDGDEAAALPLAATAGAALCAFTLRAAPRAGAPPAPEGRPQLPRPSHPRPLRRRARSAQRLQSRGGPDEAPHMSAVSISWCPGAAPPPPRGDAPSPSSRCQRCATCRRPRSGRISPGAGPAPHAPPALGARSGGQGGAAAGRRLALKRAGPALFLLDRDLDLRRPRVSGGARARSAPPEERVRRARVGAIPGAEGNLLDLHGRGGHLRPARATSARAATAGLA
jgi:hypothetical protein